MRRLTINGQSPRQFLAFWRPIRERDGDEARWAAFDKGARELIRAIRDDELAVFEATWTEQERDVEDLRRSLNDRSNYLITFASFFAALGSLAALVLDGADLPAIVGFAVAAAPLTWCAVASLFLAVRTMQVGTWVRSELPPRQATVRDLRREVAADRYYGVSRNRETVRVRVGYLRDAQTYQMGALVSLVFLAVISLSILAAKDLVGPSPGSPAPPSSAPATLPTVTTPASLTPTPASSPAQPSPVQAPSPSPLRSPGPSAS